MDTMEKGWEENREEYLKKAYGAARFKDGPVPMNEVVDRWDMLTDDALKHYLWRALETFGVNGVLEVEQNGDQKLLDVDPSASMAELVDEDLEFELGEGTSVRKDERDDYREFGDFQAPVIPTFVAWEHVERNSEEVFPYEDPDMRGAVSRDTTAKGDKEIWLGFYNNDAREESSTWINQIFRGLEVKGEEESFSTNDIFTDRNRENYMEGIWNDRPTTLRQRGYNLWEAAAEAVEEKVPQLKENYDKNVEGRGWQELDEFDLVKREFRLMVGEDEYDEENPTYIEQIVEDYYGDGLHRDSGLLEPFLQDIESTRFEEGDMNLGEATRGSDTSDAKKQRNQAYMSHYLDLVWQLSQERYAE
jgi:hypothetical protein